MYAERASASGAIDDLRRLGAIEGIHYRVAPPSEDITRYPVAIDAGPMVELHNLTPGSVFMPEPGFAGFAVVNAAGMDLVGCPVIAGSMREGSLPSEIAYIATAND